MTAHDARGEDRFLSVERARERILEAITPLGRERVMLDDASGRVLAAPVVSPVDWPRFDNAAMDGFAVRFDDLAPLAAGADGVTLRIAGEVSAGGAVPEQALTAGEAARIMTGARLPPGADTVVMVEDTAPAGADAVRVLAAPDAGRGAHIRRQGEDVATGQTLFEAGERIDAGLIGLLASFGRAQLSVHRRVRVALVATGSELVEVDAPVGPGQIVNSSSYMLAAQLRSLGAVPVPLPIARDARGAIERAFIEALGCADLVLSTGGVSVGEHDHVRDVIEGLGEGGVRFWQVSMKPGKPLAFGVARGVPLIGLPGNPVSSFVTFLQFARPAIEKAGGLRGPWAPVRVRATLTEAARGARRRVEFLRGWLRADADGALRFTPHPRQGSANVHSLAALNALGVLAPGAALSAGDAIEVEPFGPLLGAA